MVFFLSTKVFGLEGCLYRVYRAAKLLKTDRDYRSYLEGHVAGYRKAIDNHDKGLWCKYRGM